ncbi:hypothetical protein E2562_019954 [Oryza meyeriana var. granulata]|uniref:Uncharacterized protein n=1 Tax=Oryza meyeriana var. granulata TaxID=110450 RepID=A0A6G1CGZ1_9ORYZ|nr:hypothetical protein E2562_019954 [Oryza meyeriana var. granulata]
MAVMIVHPHPNEGKEAIQYEASGEDSQSRGPKSVLGSLPPRSVKKASWATPLPSLSKRDRRRKRRRSGSSEVLAGGPDGRRQHQSKK